MPPSVRTLRYTQRELQFGGGLNSIDPATEIADNELTQCNNFYIGDAGQLIKRPGLFRLNNSKLNDQNVFFLGMDWTRGTGVISHSGTPYGSKLDLLIGTMTGLTGLPASDGITWSLWINDVTYLGFQNSGVRTLTTATAVSGAIANSGPSSTAAYHKNMIFTNVPSVPGRVAFSDPLDPVVGSFTWTSTNFIPTGLDDREDITCLVSMGDLLIIFKSTSIWTLYVQGLSPADWVVRRIASGVGCAAQRSMIPALLHRNEVYFISSLGLFKTNGSSVVDLSRKIWSNIDPGFTYNSYGQRLTRWRDLLILTGVSANNLSNIRSTWVFNTNTGAWSSWDMTISGVTGGFFDVVGFPSSQYGGLVRNTIFAIYNGIIYTMDDSSEGSYDAYIAAGYNSYADGQPIGSPGIGNYGTAYTSTFKTKEFSSFIDWYWRIKWSSLEYIARTPGPTFNMIGDGSARASVTPGFHATLRKGYKIPGAGRCRVFQLNCSHALASPFEFYRGEFHFGLKTHISQSGTP